MLMLKHPVKWLAGHTGQLRRVHQHNKNFLLFVSPHLPVFVTFQRRKTLIAQRTGQERGVESLKVRPSASVFLLIGTILFGGRKQLAKFCLKWKVSCSMLTIVFNCIYQLYCLFNYIKTVAYMPTCNCAVLNQLGLPVVAHWQLLW